jgi:hypothetical protein
MSLSPSNEWLFADESLTAAVYHSPGSAAISYSALPLRGECERPFEKRFDNQNLQRPKGEYRQSSLILPGRFEARAYGSAVDVIAGKCCFGH